MSKPALTKITQPPPAPDARAGAQRRTLITTPAPSPEAPQPAPARVHEAADTEEKE